MGGEVTVASELGRGSTFTVRLPREVAGPLPEQSVPGADMRPPTTPRSRS